MDNRVKKKLKFLFVSSDKFPPFRIDVVVLFGKELARRGHKIDYLLQSEANNKKFFKTSYSQGRAFVGATDNGTKFVNRLRKHCLSFLHDCRMIRLAKVHKYDFIQVKDKFIAAFIGLLVSKLTRRKFFFWLSYPFPEADIYEYKAGTARYPYLYCVRGAILKFFLYSIILPLSDHVFAQSDQMKNDIMKFGIPADKITPVPMGIDADDYSNADKSGNAPIKKEPNGIIYLGTMQKIRRIDFVIRVFRKVLNRIPDAKLFMVGGSENPDDLHFLKKQSMELKVDHATEFTGNLPRLEAIEFIRRAAVGISPFFPTPILNSTSPTKLIEYMAMGTPTVANDHPEQRKVIGESEAGYCVPYDEEAFVSAIVKMLKNPERLKIMGKRGKAYTLKTRSYKVIAESLEMRYYALLS